MFNSPKPNEYITDSPSRTQEAHTVIARGVKVEGDLVSQGNVLIEGEVQGTLQCSGVLTVGAEAKINANVNAQEAVVSGAVDGNLTVIKRLDIKSTAKINGDITAESVSIENGAIISGRFTVGNKVVSQSRQQTPARKDNKLPATLTAEA